MPVRDRGENTYTLSQRIIRGDLSFELIFPIQLFLTELKRSQPYLNALSIFLKTHSFSTVENCMNIFLIFGFIINRLGDNEISVNTLKFNFNNQLFLCWSITKDSIK